MNRQYKIVFCIVALVVVIAGAFGIVASADSQATVTVYKQVDSETDTVVDLKYYELIGVANDLENAVTMIKNSGAKGGLIDISEGTLTVTNRQDITMSNVIIKGAGKDKTTIVGNATNFNNCTNGLASSSLSSEYKAILGLHAENIKVMDLTVSAGDSGYLEGKTLFGKFIETGRADLKTVRVNSGVAYFEDVEILGSKTRTNLMVGTSGTTSTVYAFNVVVGDTSNKLFYGATEVTNGSVVDTANSYLGGSVVGSTDNIGAGYYKLSYAGVTAYTTIPYAIESYNNGAFAELMTATFVSENADQGKSVAEAMTADLTSVLNGSTLLLYGNDCDGMRELAVEFRAALATLSSETDVSVEASLAALDEAIALSVWHSGIEDGLCDACGANLNVEVDTLDELVAALASAENLPILITAQIVIPEGTTLVLDLNGKTVNSVYNNGSTTNHIYALTNRGILTVTDTSADKNGSINSRGMYNYGELTLEAGAINAIDGNGGYALNNQSGSTFVMNGGVVAATYEDDFASSEGGYDATAMKVPAGATATLNGGEVYDVCDFTYAIECQGTLIVPENSTVLVQGNHGAISVFNGEATINGGAFKTTVDDYGTTDNVIYIGGGKLVINGGSFIGDSDVEAGGACICDAKGTAVINGGSFSGSSGGDVWGTNGTTINGGVFENLIEKSHITSGSYLGYNSDSTKLLVVPANFVVFKGASIRYELADGSEKGLDSADLRFSYVFSSDFGFEVDSWGWNYKLGASRTGSKVGTYHDENGRTNLVFTNIAYENFDKEIASQIWFKLDVEGEAFTVSGDYNVRTVLQVVNAYAELNDESYAEAKDYAIRLRDEYEAYLSTKEEN